MVIWGIVTWWYTDGWRQCLLRVQQRLEATLDYFSIDLLLRTLFAPFRQIAAGQVRGPLDVQVRAFFDRLISRIVGATVRMIMIFIGALVIVCNAIAGGILLVAWAVIPLLPLVGLGLFFAGWMPWSR